MIGKNCDERKVEGWHSVPVFTTLTICIGPYKEMKNLTP